MKKLLIAEISNHHFGDIVKAKELIYEAKRAGADAVKSQVFCVDTMTKCGSMTKDFYNKCLMTLSEYTELWYYGIDIGIDVFYSVISTTAFRRIETAQKWRKYPAGEFLKKEPVRIDLTDSPFQIVSFKYAPKLWYLKNIFHTRVMYATDYMKEFDTKEFYKIKKALLRDDIGLSHHGLELESLLRLVNFFYFPTLEKHFYLGDNIRDTNGSIYRDCLHSLTPPQFAQLAIDYKKGKSA